MVRIIEKPTEFEITCRSCESRLAYSRIDIAVIDDPSGVVTNQIVCPNCNCNVRVLPDTSPAQAIKDRKSIELPINTFAQISRDAQANHLWNKFKQYKDEPTWREMVDPKTPIDLKVNHANYGKSITITKAELDGETEFERIAQQFSPIAREDVAQARIDAIAPIKSVLDEVLPGWLMCVAPQATDVDSIVAAVRRLASQATNPDFTQSVPLFIPCGQQVGTVLLKRDYEQVIASQLYHGAEFVLRGAVQRLDGQYDLLELRFQPFPETQSR